MPDFQQSLYNCFVSGGVIWSTMGHWYKAWDATTGDRLEYLDFEPYEHPLLAPIKGLGRHKIQAEGADVSMGKFYVPYIQCAFYHGQTTQEIEEMGGAYYKLLCWQK